MLQVEAATGAEDVVRFCGGLEAVLGAAGLCLQKALPSQHAATSSLQPHVRSQPSNQQAREVTQAQSSAALDDSTDQGSCVSGQQGAESSRNSTQLAAAQSEALMSKEPLQCDRPKRQVACSSCLY